MSDTAGTTSVEPATDRPIDIPALTGLRAVAAGTVVVHHMRPLVDAIAPGPIADAARPVLMQGMLGVDLFFLLSGFIIAHNYAHVLTTRAPGAWRCYLSARVARIYPLHLVTFLLIVAVLGVSFLQGRADLTGQEHTPLGFVGNLFMLGGIPGVTPWNFPSWSLTCEFAMYLLFPLIAARVLRARWTTALAVATVALSLQMAVMFGLSPTTDDLGSVAMGWPRVAGEFLAGAMAWVVWRRVLRPGRWGDAVVVLCTTAACWLLLTGQAWLWTIPLFAVTIPALACATGPVGRVLSHPVSRWGGRISFAVYLVHIPVITATVIWVVAGDLYVRHSGLAATLALGAVVGVTVAAGALLHHVVEEPARRWLRPRLAPRSARRDRDHGTATRARTEDVPSTVRA